MARYWFLLLVVAVSTGLVIGCAGSPYRIARMNVEEIRSVSHQDLCFAYDQTDRTPLVVEEVKRRGVNCVQILRQAHIPINFIDGRSQSQNIAPTTMGDCSAIEFMGVYNTGDVVGIRGYFAKIRNKSNITKIVTVAFYTKSSPRGAQESTHVKAGDIESIKLDVSDRPPKDVRIVSCE